MLNIAAIVGRFVQTPEVRKVNGDISVCSFTIAVSDRNSKGTETVDYIDCVAWRSTADFITKYFQKGSPVSLTGTIRTRVYKDDSGTNHKITEIVVDQVRFVPGNGKREQPSSAAAVSSPETAALTEQQSDLPMDINDLPFEEV